jgi:DNA N-6-adenine-methyltransferase (Dam)
LDEDAFNMSAGRSIISLSQDWGTPENYVRAVKEFFSGQIDLDPCSNRYSIVGAETEYTLPQHDGLKESWNFRRIYVNPPYGLDRKRGTGIKNWLYRCARVHKDFGSEILALVPVATNTGHWKKFVFNQATAVCFLYDTRLKFLVNGKNGGKGAPMSCAMIYWGEDYERFFDVFIEFGAVLDLRPLHHHQIGNNGRHTELMLLSEF